MEIRPARPGDKDTLYAIALATGDAGNDASALHHHPDLIGEIYVGPYLASAPEHAFVLADDEDIPRGYVLGTPDTRAFEEWTRVQWWPDARARTSGLADPTTADRGLLELIQHPRTAPDDVVARYPAHGHIDLLATAQGHGYGRLLLERLLDSLAEVGVPGIHLEVGRANTRAQGFYARLGFTPVRTTPDSVFVARELSPR